jgi:hypothetical protein
MQLPGLDVAETESGCHIEGPDTATEPKEINSTLLRGGCIVAAAAINDDSAFIEWQ